MSLALLPEVTFVAYHEAVPKAPRQSMSKPLRSSKGVQQRLSAISTEYYLHIYEAKVRISLHACLSRYVLFSRCRPHGHPAHLAQMLNSWSTSALIPTRLLMHLIWTNWRPRVLQDCVTLVIRETENSWCIDALLMSEMVGICIHTRFKEYC